MQLKLINAGIALLLILVGLSTALCNDITFIAPEERPQAISSKIWPHNHFLTIAWHDVEDDEADQRYLSVRTSALNEQFAWLYYNGYQVVSVQDVLDAHKGVKTLPSKAVLLSFDDGYRSFYNRVWPLLKAWHYPALWAPVGSWIDAKRHQPVDFGGLQTPRDKFATWEMVRELSQSPLVEIGAHTWNAHYGVQANPQGSKEPAIASRIYDPAKATYETDEQFIFRVNNDVTRITAKIASVTGKKPRAWVWPYGAANGESLSEIKKQGYQLAFTLDGGLGTVDDLANIPRVLISGNPSINNFALSVTQVQEKKPVRVMHADLDYVFDSDITQQSKNIDKLIQRVHDARVTHVFLQAFADPKGDGTVEALYFPNRHLPVRADLFNFVSWQLQTRAGVKVYAWMPVLSFALSPTLPRVMAFNEKTGTSDIARKPYLRLSPWSREAQKQITEIYEDLAKHATFSGLLFHDDALLTDFEDTGPEAMRAYQSAGHVHSIHDIRQNKENLHLWTRLKSQKLITFTHKLGLSVKSVRGPQVRTARNIFAQPILNPESETWYAQNYDDFLDEYDWVVPMAMPLMEGISPDESKRWLQALVNKISGKSGALDKTIIELQSRDWSTTPQKAIDTTQLVEWMCLLQLNGVKHYGYYPDNFIADQPDISLIKPIFSTNWYPEHE